MYDAIEDATNGRGGFAVGRGGTWWGHVCARAIDVAQLRNACRAYALVGASPAEVGRASTEWWASGEEGR